MNWLLDEVKDVLETQLSKLGMVLVVAIQQALG